MNDAHKKFLAREYQALWKDHGALALEARVLALDWDAPPPLTLEDVRRGLGSGCGCTLCPTRKNLVFGSGSPSARLMFVGEAPGAEEDAQGEPFRSNAGELLTKIIEAMGYTREKVYLTNVVKCRPPQNRQPSAEEVAACAPFLRQQIEAVSPEVIVALGPVACGALLGSDAPLASLRGSFHPLVWNPSVAVMPTFHPSYLLRTPQAKKTVWDDMKNVIARLETAN